MAIEFYNISPLIYSQEGVSYTRFKEGSTSRAVKKGNSYGKYDKIFCTVCMAWWRDEGREWFAMSGVEMTVPPRLKVCCLFTQRGQGVERLRDETALYTLLLVAVSPSKEMSFPRTEGRGKLGRKVGCGCLRSGWPGNVIIFGRDKAKIAFMDRPTFSCSCK